MMKRIFESCLSQNISRFGLVASVLVFSQLASGLCVKSARANLRSSPSSSSSISWTVGQYTPLIRLEKKGAWYRVRDQDGEEHWISSRIVTTSYQCVAVKGTMARLRTGPGTQYPLAFYGLADKYWPLKRIERQENWYKVEDDSGYQFWVHDSNVWRPLTVSEFNF